MPVRRVRKAYEQVNDQLRELIVSGELAPGERLPNEAVLAREFGVSRATVREALRILTAQNLIRTTKGAGGGSYVTLPTVDHISEFLRGNLNLLSEADHVTLEEFLELRELIEVPAARLAAERASPADVERLRDTIPEQPLRMTTQEQFSFNKGFHTVDRRGVREHAPLHRHAAGLHRPPDAPRPLDARPELPQRRSTSTTARILTAIAGRRCGRRRRADACPPRVPAARLRAGVAARRRHAPARVTLPLADIRVLGDRAVRRRDRGGRCSSPTSAPR